jgi:serine/threonine protein kinase
MASVPARIGKYNVEAVLGRGGMGVVYKALDPQIGRHVAIKMITSGGDESLIERFKSEAKMMGALHCPNIVTVFDVSEQDGNPYLVMQLLEGPSLESMIRKGLSLTLVESLGIIIDACNGLAYAHQHGVIHRDIKPGNIIVLQDGINDGMAVIVDFGIARIMGDTGLTRPDQVIGSIYYMSAEQLQAKELDNRTDIYSIGVVLFQLLTGVLPFQADETAATLVKILNDLPPPLSAYLKEYPAELDGVVGRVLAKKRDDRYATAEDLAFHLMRIRDQLKSETVNQLVHRAQVAVDQEGWTQARGHLQQALRIDRHNPRAQELMNVVHERLRLQQEVERTRALRSQANEAYMDQRYDDALRLLDQAVTLDAKNSDLLAFRDSVRGAKERATMLRRALRRAEAALQDGDLDEAQSAADDALKIDPHDAQAKAIKVVVSQHVEDRSRQDQLRKLLDQARDQIAACDLTGAFATLRTAEPLDPTSHELQTIAKMAASAREQERRRSEAEEFRRQIESALVQEDYSTAVTRAEEGLRKFPQEQSLIRLKALAEAQRARVEQKKFIREQLAAVSSLADSGQLPQAVAVLDHALQKVPGNNELETLRSTLRERMAAEETEKRKVRAIEAILAEGRRVLQGQGARNAREFLNTHAVQYADSTQIRELYDTVRAREELDALDVRLAAEPNPAKRLQFAEEAARSIPDNQGIRQRLANLQREREQIREVIDEARGFEAAGRFSEAIKAWQKLRKSYPRVSEIEVEIKRLETVHREAKKAAKIPPANVSAMPSKSGSARPSGGLSATRMLDSAVVQDADAVAKNPVSTISGTAIDSVHTGIPSRPTSRTTRPRFSAIDFQRQLTNFVDGPKKYLPIAVMVVVLAAAYMLLGRGKQHAKEKSVPRIQVHIITNPPDAVVTSDSQPVPNGMISFVPGTTATVVVARLGYRTKSVQLRQESDGNVALEPEPLHLSIQTSEKNGTVELDGAKIADLADGAMEEYDSVPDGNSHKLSVTAHGKPLFEIELQAVPGSIPQVKTFDANGLFLITSLGDSAKLYAGSQLKNVRLGEQNIAVSPSGVDLNLSEQNKEVKFGAGSAQESVAIENSNSPMLAVYSTNLGGQLRITSNVKEATLTVNGALLKPQRRGWLVSTPPGKYTFELSAEGYESQNWTATVLPGQILPNKKIDLKPLPKAAVMASLVVVGGTPEAVVKLDGTTTGRLDTNGNLQLPDALGEGQHSIVFAKPNFENHEISVRITAKQAELRLTDDAKLTPWPKLAFQAATRNVTVTYKRVGDSQTSQTPASAKLTLPPGEYEFTPEAPGFHGYPIKLNLVSGYDGSVPLKLDPVPNYQFQDATQLTYEAEWIKSKDPHAFVYLKPGLLHETLIFAKPGKTLFWNKKIEWKIEASDGSGLVDYVLDGQKLVRKLVVGEAISDAKEAKVDVAAATQTNSLSVHIQVDGSQVLISNDKGVTLDDYTVPQHDLSGGRIGFKTESQFVVRDK